MDSPKLPVHYCNHFCDILNDAIAKLELISSLPNNPDDGLSDEGVCHSIIDLKTFLPCKEIQGRLNIEKFSQECVELTQLLRNLADELKTHQSFNTLIKYVDDTNFDYIIMHDTLENFNRQKSVAKELRETFKSLKTSVKQKQEEMDNKLYNLSLEKQQLTADLEQEKNYCQAWTEAQVQQTSLQLCQVEKSLEDHIFETSNKSFETEEVSLKICKFYREKIRELQDETARLSAEYDKQIDEFEMKKQIAWDEKRRLMLMINSEHEKFETRDREIKAYQELKRKKAADKKLRELQEVKVVVIQAWWRGLMVRKHLGKFKAYKKRVKEIKKEFRKARPDRNKNKKRK